MRFLAKGTVAVSLTDWASSAGRPHLRKFREFEGLCRAVNNNPELVCLVRSRPPVREGKKLRFAFNLSVCELGSGKVVRAWDKQTERYGNFDFFP